MVLKLLDITHKLIRNVQDYGWSISVSKVVHYMIKPFYFRRIYRIYKIKTQQQLSYPQTANFDIRFEQLDENDDSAIKQIEYQAEWLRGKVRSRIIAGDFCMVALHKDNVAGFNLIAFGEVYIPLLQMKRIFRNGTAWSDHINIHKDYRKRGLASELRRRILGELQKRGVKKLYGGTLSSNIASLKLTRSVGFQEFADVEYTKLLTNKKWRTKRFNYKPYPSVEQTDDFR